ncbi:MAG: class I SAM-dependent methyltransferase [Pseudomonadota bacterium]
MTDAAHAWLRPRLRPGDWVLDATAGGGRDTLALARAVAPGGRVFALDIQEAALEQTRERIFSERPEITLTLAARCHSQLNAALPTTARGRLAAAVFNLGYLPGSPDGPTTMGGTTRRALSAAWQWLCPGGGLSIVAYRGHAEGRTELGEVEAWLAETQCTSTREVSPGTDGPIRFQARRPLADGRPVTDNPDEPAAFSDTGT